MENFRTISFTYENAQIQRMDCLLKMPEHHNEKFFEFGTIAKVWLW